MGLYSVRDKQGVLSLLRGYRSSGLSAKEYCRKNGVSLSTFWNWHKRFKGEIVEKTLSVYVCLEPTDMRKSFDSLAGLVHEVTIQSASISPVSRTRSVLVWIAGG